MTDERNIVVVGGVAGGASAAARARRCNEAANIVVFERDRHVSFANCGLPYYIGEEIPERDDLLVATPALFRDRFRIDVRVRHEVVHVDRNEKWVEVKNLEDGETFRQPWDRLILSTGAAPIVPAIEGVDARNVFTLRNLEDTDRIKAWIDEHGSGRAVVVGAGFIGLELAEQFRRRELQTTVVELADQVLPPLDPEMAALVHEELERNDVRLHLGDGIDGLRLEDGRASGVVLNSGTVVDADFVVLGIGVRPNVALAKLADIELGPAGGIRVNDFLQTSDPAVYAVGDAVEYPHAVVDVPMRVPLAGPANRAGRIAGEHAARDRAQPMAPVAGTAVVRVFGLTAGTTGLGTKFARRSDIACRSVVVQAPHHAGYFPGAKNLVLKLVYAPESGRILGAQAVGAAGVDKRIDVVAVCLRFDGTVHDLAGVDLCYAPPYGSAKDPVHMAAFAAQNDLEGFVPAVAVDEELGERQVVDVRTEREVQAMHMPGALHVPIHELRDRLHELDSDRSVVVMCHSGKRAHVAARILAHAGFRDVANLTGGISMRRRSRPEEVVHRGQ